LAIFHFPTIVQNQSSTRDNIFTDIHRIKNYIVCTLYNGLSDHDVQLLIVKDINLQLQNHHTYTIRNIHKYSVEDFKNKINYESWLRIFSNNDNMDVYTLFKKVAKRGNKNHWITPDTRTYCDHKNIFTY
jgi:hypothetical protein